jgi:hypothetical protein
MNPRSLVRNVQGRIWSNMEWTGCVTVTRYCNSDFALHCNTCLRCVVAQSILDSPQRKLYILSVRTQLPECQSNYVMFSWHRLEDSMSINLGVAPCSSRYRSKLAQKPQNHDSGCEAWVWLVNTRCGCTSLPIPFIFWFLSGLWT